VYADLSRAFFPEVTPVLHFVNATVDDALHGTRHGTAPAWAGIISDGSVAGFVPDISYNQTGRRQSLAQAFNMGEI
jgi:hypothetical protein